MQTKIYNSQRNSFSHNRADYDIPVNYENKNRKNTSDCYKKSTHSKGKSKFININLLNINAKQIITEDINDPNKEFYNNFLSSLKLNNSSNHNGSKRNSKAKNANADSLSSRSSQNGRKIIHPVGKEFNKKIQKINLSTVNKKNKDKDKALTNSVDQRKRSYMINEIVNNNIVMAHNTNSTCLQQQQQLQLTNNTNTNKDKNNKENSLKYKKGDQSIDVNKNINPTQTNILQENRNKINTISRPASLDISQKKEEKLSSKQIIEKVIQTPNHQPDLTPEEKPKEIKKKLFLCCIPYSNKKENE